MRPCSINQSILWLLRLVNLVILVVSSEFIHLASEFSAAELTMKQRNFGSM